MARFLSPPKVTSKPPAEIAAELNGDIPLSKLEVVDRPVGDGIVWLLASKPARGMRAMHAAIQAELGVTLSSTGRGRTLREQWHGFGGNQHRYIPCTKTEFDAASEPKKDPPRKQWHQRDRDRVRAALSDLDIPDEEFWIKKRKRNGNFPATAASPGTSPHGQWCADDLAIGPFPRADSIGFHSEVGQWLFAHEKEFGFGHGLSTEAWHVQWFMGDVMPQRVLDFEQEHGRGPGPVDPGRRGRRRRHDQEDDDMAKLFKVDGLDAVFAVNGMVASWIRDPGDLDIAFLNHLVPSNSHFDIVDKATFRALKLVGQVPPGFKPSDFDEVIAGTITRRAPRRRPLG